MTEKQEIIEYYYRGVSLPEKTGPELARENEYLYSNFPVLLENLDAIIKTERYFYCYIKQASLGLMYIGGGKIPLGVLALLWKNGDARGSCPDCSSTVYVVGAGGSPLSGTNTYWGYCPSCKERVSNRYGSPFYDLWIPMRDLINRYPNKTTVKRTRIKLVNARSPLEVLNEKPIPDEVVRESIYGLEIEQVIRELKGEGTCHG